MKKTLLTFLCIASCSFAAPDLYSQNQTDSTKVKTIETSNKKEEKNRNEMLNADSNSSPRVVNIGLPFLGDIIIMENGLPVVYYFYPTSPIMAWRMSNSLSKMGLLSFAEGALTYGKVGYAVQSEDRTFGSSFKGYATIYGNSFGSSKYDIALTGPLGKKGWGYMANIYQTFERGTGINYRYTPWAERSQMYKLGLTKKYKNGQITALYKYMASKGATNTYNPLIYRGNGVTEARDNFTLGSDSYVLGTGLIPVNNPSDGTKMFANLADDKYSKSISNNFYVYGNHDFGNGYKLTYSSMYQKMKSPLSILFPLSLMVSDPDQQGTAIYKYYGTSNQYTGTVQLVMSQLLPQADNTTSISRMELTKKLNNHDLRIGLNYQYNHRKYEQQSSLYYQTSEANPQLLDRYAGSYKITSGGMLPGTGYGGKFDDAYKKAAFYFSDDMKLTKFLDLGIGGRIEHQDKHVVQDPYITEFISGKPLISCDFNNKWNKVGIANTVLKLTRKFGLLADGTYNQWNDSYFDYTARDANGVPIAAAGETAPRQTVPNSFKTTVTNWGVGVYYNLGNTISLVSKVTSINKNNIKYTGATITNPSNPTQQANFDPVFYNIKTLGWTTDIVANPFKNFNIHYLLTLQKPQYDNFKYSAFNVTYNYNNNVIPELSQILMEIDPSYTFMKGSLKAWVSLRYFGKQYANPTNAFYYNPWWENFGGLDYTINRNFTLKLQVTNFLNQSGVKGSIQGADQITSDANYIGRTVIASCIRPRTLELTANIKF